MVPQDSQRLNPTTTNQPIPITANSTNSITPNNTTHNFTIDPNDHDSTSNDHYNSQRPRTDSPHFTHCTRVS